MPKGFRMQEESSSGSIPMRQFGRHDQEISALGFGGHHLGDAADEQTATQIVHEAVDNGVTFFDNCWEYHRGKSEVWMGNALKGRRDKVFLMTKVCTMAATLPSPCRCSSNPCAVCRPIIWTCGKSTA